MKKDKKWIHKEVDKLRIYSNPDIPTSSDDLYGQYVSGVNSAVEEVLGLINQLDELEVLSQEWIDKNKTSIDRKLDGTPIYKVREELLQNLIAPKQELPVVPKYVADWITKYREKYDLYPALRLLENNTLVWGTIYEWYRMNTHKFVNAYLTGEYEVEEEPLYFALIKGHELVNDEVEWATKYWNLWVSEGCVFPYDKSETTDDFSIIMSKEDWNKYGINDLNADFIKVEKEEE